MTELGWQLSAPALAGVLSAWSSTVLRTSRVTETGPGAGFQGPAVYVNWHRFLPFLVMHHGQHRRCLLVSPAPYMAAIRRWSAACGLSLVQGASGASGREGAQVLAERVRAGTSAFIAVDGPAGPAFQVKRGCVDVARSAGVPLIPVGYTSRRGFFHPRRWDHWLLPVPFDELVVTYGAPLTVGADEPLEQALARVGEGLRAVSNSREW